MQKKIIALAIAAAAASSAFAQSNVTIYGRMDYGYVNRGSQDGASRNVDNKGEFASGVQSGSRIGFKGAEDLGNGLKAIFQAEFQMGIDSGTTSAATWGNRNSFVGLTGAFGTAIGGRVDGARYNAFGKVDPFGLGSVGNMASLTPQVDRADNAIAYVSPSFSGLTVTLAHATRVAGQEGTATTVAAVKAACDAAKADPLNAAIAPSALAACNATAGGVNAAGLNGNNGDGRLYTMWLQYENGPIYLTLDHEQIKVKGVDGADAKVTTVGGSYDFGMVKLGALYDEHDPEGANNKRKTWLIGASAPFGKTTVRVAYGSTDIQGIDNDKTSKIAVGATYALSKRTSVYADYAKLSNDNNAGLELTTSAAAFSGDHASRYGVRGLNIGLAHTF